MVPSLVLSAASEMVLMLFLLISLVHVGFGAPPGCSVSLKNYSGAAPPLFVRSEQPLGAWSLLRASEGGVVHVRANTSFTLACPGARNQLLHKGLTTGLRQLNVTCISGSELHVRSVGMVKAESLSCAARAERVAVGNRLIRCGAGARGLRMSVGIRLLHGFLELVSTCFDDDLLTPIYANYTVTQGTAITWLSGGPSQFSVAGSVFGGVNFDLQYKRQPETLRELLGSVSNKINDSLVPGFLSSRFSSALQPHDNITLFFLNAAPQWASINVGAWAGVERAVDALAAARGDLQVVTGTHGVATLPDAQGRPTELFLYVDGVERKMPVPALFWKVVYDPHTMEGAAIVFNNNPSQPLTSLMNNPKLTNICDKLHWLRLAPSAARSVYCCEVETLRQRVNDLPPLDVRGLLVNSGKDIDPSTTASTSTSTSTTTPQSNTERTVIADSVTISHPRIGLSSKLNAENGVSPIFMKSNSLIIFISLSFVSISLHQSFSFN